MMPNQQALAEATYRHYLPQLRGWVGWFALVKGEKLAGIFPTHAAAANAWMAMYGPVPALIRRIEPVAPPVTAPQVTPIVSIAGDTRIPDSKVDHATAGLSVAFSWAFVEGNAPGAPKAYAA